MALSVSDQLLHTTIRIECISKDGSGSIGTGFFYSFHEKEDKGTITLALVTNKHVIEGAEKGILHFTLADNNHQPILGKKHTFIISDFESSWTKHPDSSVDLAILPGIGEIIQRGIDTGIPLFIRSINKPFLLTDDDRLTLTGIEDIIMIGYPIGLWDSINNLPIVRRGITATHPNIDYEGKSEFMIDAACFPGSSGSPVYLLKQGVFPTEEGTYLGQRVKFLGVLHAGPQHTVDGKIQIVNIPTRQEAISISNIPMNLGYVIKADRINDFETILK